MLRAMRDLGNPLVVAAAPSAPAATEPTGTAARAGFGVIEAP